MNYQRHDVYEEMLAHFFGQDYEPSKLEQLVDIVNRRKCKSEGHKIVDEGYGGPEGGCMDLTCTRCGWSQYIRLY